MFVVGSALLAPPSSVPRRHGFGDGRRLTDLILLRDPRMRHPANTRVWLDALQPDRWFHCVEGLAGDAERIARVVTGTAVGLVLSGGGARAYCHIGAVKALQDARVPIDFAGGASMGAVVAAGPALGVRVLRGRRGARRPDGDGGRARRAEPARDVHPAARDVRRGVLTDALVR